MSLLSVILSAWRLGLCAWVLKTSIYPYSLNLIHLVLPESKKIEGAKGRPMFGADVRELVLFLFYCFAVMVVSWKEGCLEHT